MTKRATSFVFPKGFLWGTATSAHQVEGNNTSSDWWHWEHAAKNRKQSGVAVNQYNLFKQDFLLAKALHNNAHRLSLEWSRLEPIEGSFSKKEIAHYKNVLRTLKKQGFTTFVTVHHFTNPQWFSLKGAFEKRRNI